MMRVGEKAVQWEPPHTEKIHLCQSLESMNVTLQRKIFAGVNELRILRSGDPGLSLWALEPMKSVLIRDSQNRPIEEKVMQRWKQILGHKLRKAGNHKVARGSKEGPPVKPWKSAVF